MNKRFVTVTLTLVMLFSLSSISVSATSSDASTEENFYCEEISIRSGESITVKYPNSIADSISTDEVMEIVEEDNLSDGDVLIIWDRGYAEPAPPSPSPMYELWKYSSKKTLANSNLLLSKQFLLSVARGQTTSFTSSVSKTYKTTFSGSVPYSIAEFGAEFSSSLTVTYTRSDTFAGPPENSSNNSRSYYVRFYGNEYRWTQTKTNNRDGYSMTTSGQAYCPKYYDLYSIDKKV